MSRMLSDFIIDTKGRCFFCLDKTSLPNTKFDEEDFPPGLPTTHSLQHLSRFLRMDMRKVFIEKGDIPPNLTAKVEMSRLNAQLCARCTSLNETFSKLCRRLEKIEMEVMSSLEHIYSELLKTQSANLCEQLMNSTNSSSSSAFHADDEWRAKIGILEVVRKEAIQKCSSTIQTSRPRVRVSNLTKIDITKIQQKHKLNSRRQRNCDIGCQIKIELDETFTNPSFEEQAMDRQSDFGSKRGSPPSRNLWEENVVAKSEHEKSTPGTKYSLVKRTYRRDSRISENIEKVKLTGAASAPKYRCRMCRQVFTHRISAARHIKSIHFKEKSYQCQQCFKTFSTRQNLEAHRLIHSGLKPFKCHLCLKEFRRKAQMRKHLLIHSGS